jgi:hypothetical protein
MSSVQKWESVKQIGQPNGLPVLEASKNGISKNNNPLIKDYSPSIKLGDESSTSERNEVSNFTEFVMRIPKSKQSNMTLKDLFNLDECEHTWSEVSFKDELNFKINLHKCGLQSEKSSFSAPPILKTDSISLEEFPPLKSLENSIEEYFINPIILVDEKGMRIEVAVNNQEIDKETSWCRITICMKDQWRAEKVKEALNIQNLFNRWSKFIETWKLQQGLRIFIPGTTSQELTKDEEIVSDEYNENEEELKHRSSSFNESGDWASPVRNKCHSNPVPSDEISVIQVYEQLKFQSESGWKLYQKLLPSIYSQIKKKLEEALQTSSQ